MASEVEEPLRIIDEGTSQALASCINWLISSADITGIVYYHIKTN